MKWLKQITFSDYLLLAGFGAVCYGCAQLASWSAWVVGGVLMMIYALNRARAIAWMKRRNRDAT